MFLTWFDYNPAYLLVCKLAHIVQGSSRNCHFTLEGHQLFYQQDYTRCHA